MAKSKTPRYVFNIRYQSDLGRHTSYMVWHKEYGKPTTENLAKWVRDFEQSCQEGCNAHLGYDPKNPVSSATILDQQNDRCIVATWNK